MAWPKVARKAKPRKLSTTITSLPKGKRASKSRGMTGKYPYGFADPRKKSAVKQPKRGAPGVATEKKSALLIRGWGGNAMDVASRAIRRRGMTGYDQNG